MDSNSILLKQVTLEKLLESINEGIKCKLDDFKKELNANDPHELLTREQTCKFLQIDSSTLWHWTNKGKVKAYAISSRRYYKKNELLDCLIPTKKGNDE